MKLYVYSDRVYFTGKVKDLKKFIALYLKEYSTIAELIKKSLH